MSTWQEEQEIKTNKRREQIKELAEKIRAPLEKEGFDAKLTKKTRHGDESDYERIVITAKDPPSTMFRAEIFTWSNDCKAQFSLEQEHCISVQIPRSDGGYGHTETRKYSYTGKLSDEELLACGLAKVDYRRMELVQFRRDFKIDKNTKLILNDILPGLRAYREVMRLAEPRILKQIKDEDTILELQRKVAALSKWKRRPEMIGSYEFEIEGVGKVAISQWGDVKLEKKISIEELKKLVGIK